MLNRCCSIKEIEVYLLCEILISKDALQGQKTAVSVLKPLRLFVIRGPRRLFVTRGPQRLFVIRGPRGLFEVPVFIRDGIIKLGLRVVTAF